MTGRLGKQLSALVGGPPELGVLVARTVDALGEGHTCLPLRVVCASRARAVEAGEGEALPTLSEARELLARSDAVQLVQGGERLEPIVRPFVLDGDDRLYLARLYEHERRLAAGLLTLAENRASAGDAGQLTLVDRYFPPGADPGQRRAAEACLQGGLTLVTGGPGTGKTSTVVRIVAVLIDRAVAAGAPLPRVLLLAPTGKAAARVAEAVRGAKAKLVDDGQLSAEVALAIPDEARTVHRALGVKREGGFWHHARNQLPFDVVIVDEASMVDVALMRHLVEALLPRASLVLLGDRDQLVSVEAGSVLSELSDVAEQASDAERSRETERASEAERTAERPSDAERRTVVVAPLTTSYRFRESSGIGQLARALGRGDAARSLELLEQGDGASGGDLSFVESTRSAGEPRLKERVVRCYGDALRAGDAASVLRALHGFRVLAAHRTGPAGVEALNEAIAGWLADAGVIPSTSPLAQGRIVLVTKNDPARGLSNGDVGLIWPSAAAERLAVHFERPGAPPREVSPADLPEHEPAFALTVHKSQGSEFEEVAIVLPPPTSQLLTRELLYTAITRAKARALVVGPKEAVRIAAERSVVRHSGLGARLVEAAQSGGSLADVREGAKRTAESARAKSKRGGAP